MRGKDLTGQRFGKLVVLQLDEDFEQIRGKKQRRWICQCDCGVQKSIIGAELTRTKKPQRSCGCASKERQKNFGKITFKDLTGQQFGDLTVLQKIGTNEYGYAIWECQCTCGNKCKAVSRDLLAGDALSCGCKKNSFREAKIKELLYQNQIIYKTEYSFQELKDKQPLRFDFAIFNQNNQLLGLIEHQGAQHFDIKNNWFTESLQRHDQMKKTFCLEHNIPLYEIRFDDNLEEKFYEILQLLQK